MDCMHSPAACCDRLPHLCILICQGPKSLVLSVLYNGNSYDKDFDNFHYGNGYHSNGFLKYRKIFKDMLSSILIVCLNVIICSYGFDNVSIVIF